MATLFADSATDAATFSERKPAEGTELNDETLIQRAVQWVAGVPIALPAHLLAQYPELSGASWRRGGVAVLVGGWCLGRASVSGITLWRTVWVAPGVVLAPELLLHELRHVHQFDSDALFPLRYVWCSLRHGYIDNPYEVDARTFARQRLADHPPTE